MTAPSDPVDVAEVRALLGAATSGPWGTYDPNEGMWPPRPLYCVANDEFHNPSGSDEDPWVAVDIHVDTGSAADAALIAAAPTLLAELADEVERLRGVVGRVREVLTEEHQPVQYGHDGITQACRRCSSWSWEGLDDETVPWPCPTVVALDPPAQADTEEST